MDNISLPKKFTVTPADKEKHRASVAIEPLFPGYGTTMGNALRRILLSSLPGGAVNAIKIKGVTHEFSTVPHVREDVVDIILNMKRLRLKVFSDQPVQLSLHVKGKQEVTGADIAKEGQVEVINSDLVLFHTTEDAADVDMTIWAERGRGYKPVEAREKGETELGVIAIDALYSPVLNVAWQVEDVRVGQRTDYERLVLDITTDGVVSPEEAVKEAAKVLIDHFTFIGSGGKEQALPLVAGEVK